MNEFVKKGLYVLLAALCGLICIGAFFPLGKTYLYGKSPAAAVLYMTAAVALLLGLWVWGYRRLMRLSRKGLLIASGLMGAVMLLIYIFVLMNFRAAQASDSHVMLDVSLYLSGDAELPLSEGLPYSAYYARYGNQYFMTICLAAYGRLLRLLHITDQLLPFYMLNVASAMLGALFTWLLALRCRGLRFAAQTMLLCLCNPVYYCMLLWIYSNEMSVGLFMAVLYFGVRLYQTETVRGELRLAAAEALTAVVGYFIRPTSVIPLIALMICAGFWTLKHRERWKKTARCAAVCIAAAAVLYGGIAKLNDVYFSSVSDGNYPVTHWLMMASHGEGRWNIQDEYFTRSFETKEEKRQATLERTLENYRGLGVGGTIRLFYIKTMITWADGMSEIESRCAQDLKLTRAYPLIFGGQNDFARIYSYAYRAAVVLLIAAAALYELVSPKKDKYFPVFALTLFGGIVFYWLWEAKESYCIPFLMLMSLLASYGAVRLAERATQGRKAETAGHIPAKPVKRHAVSGAVIWGVLLTAGSTALAAVVFGIWHGNGITHRDYTLLCNNANFSEGVPDMEADGSVILQEFYASKAIDMLAIRAVEDRNFDQSDYVYRIELLNADNETVDETTVAASELDATRNTLYVSLHRDATAEREKCCLRITKLSGTVGALSFAHRCAVRLDNYDGTCYVNGEAQPYDIFMSVWSEYEAPYYSMPQALLFALLLPLLTVLLLAGGSRRRSEADKIVKYNCKE